IIGARLMMRRSLLNCISCCLGCDVKFLGRTPALGCGPYRPCALSPCGASRRTGTCVQVGAPRLRIVRMSGAVSGIALPDGPGRDPGREHRGALFSPLSAAPRSRPTRDSNPALTELEPVASTAGLVSRVAHRRMTVRVDSAGILHVLGGQPFTWGPSSEGGTGESNSWIVG